MASISLVVWVLFLKQGERFREDVPCTELGAQEKKVVGNSKKKVGDMDIICVN